MVTKRISLFDSTKFEYLITSQWPMWWRVHHIIEFGIVISRLFHAKSGLAVNSDDDDDDDIINETYIIYIIICQLVGRAVLSLHSKHLISFVMMIGVCGDSAQHSYMLRWMNDDAGRPFIILNWFGAFYVTQVLQYLSISSSSLFILEINSQSSIECVFESREISTIILRSRDQSLLYIYSTYTGN